MLEKLKYPIGKWEAPNNYSEELIHAWISDIESTPKSIEALVLALDESQLNWKYRPSGWSIRQVVHHMALPFYHIMKSFGLKCRMYNMWLLKKAACY